MTLFHKRWETFRYFMSRSYSPESVVYFSGFLILFAFILTTLGKGFEFDRKIELQRYVWFTALFILNERLK